MGLQVHVYQYMVSLQVHLYALFIKFKISIQLNITVCLILMTLGNCTNGDTRLQNGYNSTSGRVEVCVDGKWQTLCDKGFDSSTASVICRSLGLHPDSE